MLRLCLDHAQKYWLQYLLWLFVLAWSGLVWPWSGLDLGLAWDRFALGLAGLGSVWTWSVWARWARCGLGSGLVWAWSGHALKSICTGLGFVWCALGSVWLGLDSAMKTFQRDNVRTERKRNNKKRGKAQNKERQYIETSNEWNKERSQTQSPNYLCLIF